MYSSLIPWRKRSPTPFTGRMPRLFDRMEEDMESLLGRYFGAEDMGGLTADFVPTIDLVENEEHYEVKVDLPGLTPEEVDVEVRDGDLWISGKREEEKEEKGKTYHRVERRQGTFRRLVSLPNTIDEDKIEARFEDGVLNVTVPKTVEVKPKQIEVKR